VRSRCIRPDRAKGSRCPQPAAARDVRRVVTPYDNRSALWALGLGKSRHRTLHDLGTLDVWCPRDLSVTYRTVLYPCRTYFAADLCDLAPGSH